MSFPRSSFLQWKIPKSEGLTDATKGINPPSKKSCEPQQQKIAGERNFQNANDHSNVLQLSWEQIDQPTGSGDITAFFGPEISLHSEDRNSILSNSLIEGKCGERMKHADCRRLLGEISKSKAELKLLEQEILELVLFVEQLIYNFSTGLEKTNSKFSQHQKKAKEEKVTLMDLNKSLSADLELQRLKTSELERFLSSKDKVNQKLLQTIAQEDKFLGKMREEVLRSQKTQNLEALFVEQQKLLKKSAMEFDNAIYPDNSILEGAWKSNKTVRMHSIEKWRSKKAEHTLSMTNLTMCKEVSEKSDRTSDSNDENNESRQLRKLKTGVIEDTVEEGNSETFGKSEIECRIKMMRARIAAMRKGLGSAPTKLLK